MAPSVSTQPGAAAPHQQDWPSWRHDAERSGATKAALPAALKLLWKTQAAKQVEGSVADAWKDRIESIVTAPVVAKGVVYAAASDAGQVVALDGASGKELWRTTLGSRIDTPPTVEGGLCLAGCHDGWVYALRATDGALAWRARVAPVERRTPAFGLIESSWPVVGAVLVKGGVVYAAAGRSTETEGGIALVALDLGTGATRWAGVIGPGALRVNDALAWREGEVGWRYMRFSPATGARTFPEVLPTSKDYGGGAGQLEGAMIDGSWTITGNRKAGNAFGLGKLRDSLMVWSDATVVTTKAAFKRADETELWKVPFGRATPIDAMALAGNALVVAGHRRSRAGEMPAGWLSVLSLADGKRAADFDLDVMPAYDGLAVANGRVYVSLRDGSVACFGAAE
jgi:outer membrane protein assembly factor BamB